MKKKCLTVLLMNALSTAYPCDVAAHDVHDEHAEQAAVSHDVLSDDEIVIVHANVEYEAAPVVDENIRLNLYDTAPQDVYDQQVAPEQKEPEAELVVDNAPSIDLFDAMDLDELSQHLPHNMPGSSFKHSWLGKLLQKYGAPVAIFMLIKYIQAKDFFAQKWTKVQKVWTAKAHSVSE